jgi:OOP family OmpA-OmpF porin
MHEGNGAAAHEHGGLAPWRFLSRRNPSTCAAFAVSCRPVFRFVCKPAASLGRHGSLWLLPCLVALSQPGPSFAQTQVVDAFSPAPDQSGFSGFAATRTPGHLGVDGNLWLGYALHPVEGKDVGEPGMLLRHRVDGTAIAQLGVLSRMAFALRMPFVLFQHGDDWGGRSVRAAGFGLPALDARVRVFGEGTRPDGSVRDGTAFALRAVYHQPVAPSRPYLTDDPVRLEVAGTLDVELFGMLAGAAFGYRLRPEGPAQDGVRHELRLDAGVRVPFRLFARAFPGKLHESLLIEVGAGALGAPFFSERRTPVEGRLAYRWVISDYFVTAGVGTAFNQALGNPDLRALVGFGFSPRMHDQDADGIPDRSDKCVHLPEDRDGFQDEDGCADDDNDGDMIVDEDDRCPREAAEWGQDEDEDGCTDPDPG